MATIPASDRSMTYSPVAATGPFPIDFPVFDGTGADLFVTLNGDEAVGWTFSGTLEDGFYGSPGTWINGSITFASAISGELLIEGDREPRRVAQYGEGRGIPARDHNAELNTLTAIAQEHKRRLDALDRPLGGLFTRFVRTPRKESVPELPPKDSLRNMFFYWGPNREPMGVPTSSVVVRDGIAEFGSVIAAAGATLPAPQQYFRAAGYYAAGDGGGGLYMRAALEPVHGGKALLADGWWELKEDRPNIAQFGCSPSLSDNGPLLSGALLYASGKALFVPPRTYTVNSIVVGQDGVRLHGVRGLSKFYSTALPTGGTNVGMCMFNFDGKTGWSFEGISFDTGDITVFTGAHRIINALGCSYYSVRDCDARTPGAFVASIGCSHYDVQGNRISISSTTGAAIHDGIIDQWAGSHDFLVVNNWVEGNSIGKYGILVTGTDTDNNAAACYGFSVLNNHVRNVRWTGIWCNGRGGINYDFAVNNNRIDGVTEFHGLGISDCRDFQALGNRVRTTQGPGIVIYKEATYGAYACSDFVVSGNVVKDVNKGASSSLVEGAGIALRDACHDGIVSDNRVYGALHTTPVYLSSTSYDLDCKATNADAGTQVTVVRNDSANNNVTYNEKAGLYVPTVAGITNVTTITAANFRYRRVNNTVKVTGSVTITPTANGAALVSISLPIASNFTVVRNDLSGVAASDTGISGGMRADVTSDVALLAFTASNTSPNFFSVDFEYEVK